MPALLSSGQAALGAHLRLGSKSTVPPARHSGLNASSSSKGLLLIGQTAVKVLHLQQPDIAAINGCKSSSRGHYAEGSAACTDYAQNSSSNLFWTA